MVGEGSARLDASDQMRYLEVMPTSFETWCVVIYVGVTVGVIAGQADKPRRMFILAITCSVIAAILLAFSDVWFAKTERAAAEARMWLLVSIPFTSGLIATPAVIMAGVTRYFRDRHRQNKATPPAPLPPPGTGGGR